MDIFLDYLDAKNSHVASAWQKSIKPLPSLALMETRKYSQTNITGFKQAKIWHTYTQQVLLLKQ